MYVKVEAETYKHVNTGSMCVLLMVTNQSASKEDLIETAVYADSTGSVWSRPYTEFKENYEEIKV